MPLTIGAIRKQRADVRKTAANFRTRKTVRDSVSAARKKPTASALASAFSALDRAAKKHVIHKNKAARLKARLTKLSVKKK